MNYYIEKNIKLEGVTATVWSMEFYMNNKTHGTITVRLNPFISLSALKADKTDSLNPAMVNTQFNYDIGLIDETNGHEKGLLDYIVANESEFFGGVVKTY